jgi:hypothetical protein
VVQLWLISFISRREPLPEGVEPAAFQPARLAFPAPRGGAREQRELRVIDYTIPSRYPSLGRILDSPCVRWDTSRPRWYIALHAEWEKWLLPFSLQSATTHCTQYGHRHMRREVVCELPRPAARAKHGAAEGPIASYRTTQISMAFTLLRFHAFGRWELR